MVIEIRRRIQKEGKTEKIKKRCQNKFQTQMNFDEGNGYLNLKSKQGISIIIDASLFLRFALSLSLSHTLSLFPIFLSPS